MERYNCNRISDPRSSSPQTSSPKQKLMHSYGCEFKPNRQGGFDGAFQTTEFAIRFCLDGNDILWSIDTCDR